MTNRDKFSCNNQNDKPATSTPLRPLKQSLFLWTLLIACFAAWDIHQTEKYEGKAVSALLHESFNKDLVYRKWATMHGGVYVPITERTPPNPYLLHIRDRDITTPSGQRLTLMNPAYMTRQVHEISKEQYGLLGHITSLNPIRFENAADPWETKTLKEFEKGVKESTSKEMIDGKPYIRYMQAMIVEEGCLKCHTGQGYKKGDVRGGISVSMPWLPTRELIFGVLPMSETFYGFIWIVGVFGIVTGRRKLQGYLNERNKAEQSLYESNEILSLFMHHSPLYTYIKEVTPTESRVLKASENFLEMLGIPGSKMVGKTMEELFPSEMAAKITKDDWAVISGGGVFKVDEDYNGRSYTTVKSPLITDEKTLLAGFTIDITERKQAEDKMKESEEQLKVIFETSVAGIILVSPTGTIKFANRSMAKMFGMELPELIGTPYTAHLHDSEKQIGNELMSQLMKGHIQSVLLDRRYTRKDGTDFWGNLSGRRLENADGSLRGLVGVITDLTERKQVEEEKLALEQQFQQTQKLESLGVLSGGIAHDFNNILAIIIGYCGLTKLNFGTAEKNLPIIEEAAERAAGLCRQMLAYAGKAHLTKTNINMVKKVEDIVGMLKETLPQNTVIKTDLSVEIPLIEGDAVQLRQVVMNLIINASEAIGTEQGEVDVSLARITIIAGKAYEDYYGKPIPTGEYVCLEVTDNGCGMDDATKWRIFEPFYTTKFTGRGLGMSAVLGIIKSHAGALQLFSQLGKGTTFKVFLPLPTKDATEEENLVQPAPVAPWQGSGTILLTEDEDQVRDIAKNFLELFGFNVLEAVNGKDALELYQKNAAEITLVFTDMGMPVMDGYELFSELKKLNPELPIIVSSGYGDAEVSARIGSDNIAGIISKPYNPNQLREVLKKVVEGMGT